MNPLEKPLKHRILWSTGDLVLWAELDLFVKDVIPAEEVLAKLEETQKRFDQGMK